jgi:signal transduction histidine kinase
MSITPVQKGKSVLRPRARLIKTIGEELISSDIVALLELVKNSYDADASIIVIKFTGEVFVPSKKEKNQLGKLCKTGASIEIYDDGDGMSLKTVQECWMEPATISKKSSRESVGRGRKFTGEKGIGRFSSAKLSTSLDMITRPEGDNEVVAYFDWQDFEDSKLFLDQVNVKWEVREPVEFTGKKRGTKLILKNLNSDWDFEKFRQLKITLQRLINPVVPVTNFLIELDLPREFAAYSGIVEPPPYLTKPNYSIKGSVNGKGKLEYTYASKKLAKSESEKIDLVKTDKIFLTGPFQFDFRVWDRDSESLKQAAEENNTRAAEVRRALDEISGISIYRDGFRVLPYGEPKLDWLRLDLRRVNNPTMRTSNNQIIGFVSIDLEKNPKFVDQSNREGIVDSDELEQLKEFIIRILAELETRRYEERPREHGVSTESGLFESFSIRPLVELIQRKLPNDREAKELIDKTETTISQGVTKVQEVLSRYRRLSTLGLLVDTVLHDGNNFLALVDSELHLLVKNIKKDGFEVKKFYSHVDKITESKKILAQLFKRLEPFGGRKRGKASKVVVKDVINNSFGLFESELNAANISVDLPDSETRLVIIEADLQLILVNLLQNAIYWLKEKSGKRRIVVAIERSDKTTSIIFSDNGAGIEEKHHELIFDPYFSTKPDGIGLGLTIVGELVTENSGELSLIDNGPLDGTSFRIEFPGN